MLLNVADNEFLFQKPEHPTTMSETTYIALSLAALGERLADEGRSIVKHLDGRVENVAEHSFNLTLIAPIIAERFYPQLDVNLVARFASIHDAVEGYVGDTPTYDISDEGLRTKEELEARGLEQFYADFADNPSLVELIRNYETQQIAEARFVRVLDKCMPLLNHFLEGGRSLREYFNSQELLNNSAIIAARLTREYPVYSEIIDMRNELASLAALYLLDN
jgi:5'-deoxynucleotidase YfbR-like HD superfamily hydrolase